MPAEPTGASLGLDLTPSADNLPDITAPAPTPDLELQQPQQPKFDLSGIKDEAPRPTTRPISSGETRFQPEINDWSLSKVEGIKKWFQDTFNRSMPIKNFGQGAIHNKLGLDHRNAVDVSINPQSKEGQRLIAHLREQNIPFLAFDRAIPGVATGPHIHLGMGSHRNYIQSPVGTTIPQNKDQEAQTSYNVPQQQGQFDLSNIADEPQAQQQGITPTPSPITTTPPPEGGYDLSSIADEQQPQ